jgi:hypothetical protein
MIMKQRQAVDDFYVTRGNRSHLTGPRYVKLISRIEAADVKNPGAGTP